MIPARSKIPARSDCPINLTLEVLGDRWSLIVIRDILFGNRRHFRELLNGSNEGIASNILAARLRQLVDQGLLSRADDPSHRQKAIYSLTEKAIDLVPLLVQMGAWGRRHLATTPKLAIRQQVLEEGGPALWSELMAELRYLHLGGARPAGRASVLDRLGAEYDRIASRSPPGAPSGRRRKPPVRKVPGAFDR